MTFPKDDQPYPGLPSNPKPTRWNPRWLNSAIIAGVAGVALPVAALNLVQGALGLAIAVSTLFVISAYVAFNFNLWTTRLSVLGLWLVLGTGLLAGGRGHLLFAWLVVGFAAGAGSELLCRGATSLRGSVVTDHLTGLTNRYGLWEEAASVIPFCRRFGHSLTFVHIDLDDFKEVNDREGHAKGDRILQLCAERWGAVVRAGDTLARVGGDEFLLMLPASTASDARKVMEDLEAVSPVDLCYGVAELRDGEGVQACIERADIELYRAKAETREQS